MKTIPLTRGEFSIVDDEDYDKVSMYKWSCRVNGKYKYAARTCYKDGKKNKKEIKMHRFIMGNPEGLMVDHKNHNTMDNQKRNLRICTRQENARNQTSKTGSSSKYLGVSWHKRKQKWHAQICVGSNKVKYVGFFAIEKEAAKAYNTKALEYFGEFANLNTINDEPDK